ncbi:hypothetical protein D3C76_1248260 [compost metagenome]
MAGETLQPVALALAADIRGTLDTAIDMAAPGVVDGYPGQLREHPLQVRAGGAGDILGDATQVGTAATEQQAVVRGKAEVIGHELVVDHATVARQQRTGEVGVQWRSGHLVGPDGQQAA